MESRYYASGSTTLAGWDGFLDPLRTDEAFREKVCRQLLTEAVLALPGRLDHLTEFVGQALSLLREPIGLVRDLAEAQRRTESGGGMSSPPWWKFLCTSIPRATDDQVVKPAP